MATVTERRMVRPVGRSRAGEARSSRLPMTLYDLITAIQDVVGPEDDGLVVAAVRHLLRAGRLTERGPGTRGGPSWSAVARRCICCRGATGNTNDPSAERR